MIGAGIDEHAVRLDYEVRPPIPTGTFEPDWQALDDIGTEYLPAGGAYGIAEGADYTDGLLSVHPLPPPEAATLRFRFTGELDYDAKAVCEVEIELKRPG